MTSNNAGEWVGPSTHAARLTASHSASPRGEPAPATERQKRDRPAKNPGGMICEDCGEIFIGEEWHSWCAICAKKHASRSHTSASST